MVLYPNLESRRVMRNTRLLEIFWGHQGLATYEDAFEGGMRDDFNIGVGRTCHLCNGEGCPGCSNTGMLS